MTAEATDADGADRTSSPAAPTEQHGSDLFAALSNPDRVLYPQQGLSKRDLAEFYRDIADRILPHLRGRPLALVRCPRGRQAKCFFQKHLSGQGGPHLRTVTLTEREKTGDYTVVEDLEGIIDLIQLGVLEIHPWNALAATPDSPDRLIFDLDPGPGSEWSLMIAAARQVKAVLDAVSLQSFLRTSGGKGVHVVVPLKPAASWGEVRTFTRDVANRLAAEAPDCFVAKADKAERRGKIFIDYLRNSRGATAVATYSTRAREGAPVATPVRWDELQSLRSGNRYTVANLRRRLAALRKDPWEGFFEIEQSLSTDVVDRLRRL